MERKGAYGPSTISSTTRRWRESCSSHAEQLGVTIILTQQTCPLVFQDLVEKCLMLMCFWLQQSHFPWGQGWWGAYRHAWLRWKYGHPRRSTWVMNSGFACLTFCGLSQTAFLSLSQSTHRLSAFHQWTSPWLFESPKPTPPFTLLFSASYYFAKHVLPHPIIPFVPLSTLSHCVPNRDSVQKPLWAHLTLL